MIWDIVWTLGLLTGVRASGEVCRQNGLWGEKQSWPKIVITTPSEDSKGITYSTQDIPYSEDAIIYCSTNSTGNLTIEYNEQYLPAARINATTIRLQLEQPNVGRYTYGCTESDTGCHDYLKFTVVPLISVSSPRVRKAEKYRRQIYFVPLGDDYEIFCNGNDAEKPVHILRLTFEEIRKYKKLPTVILNRTTVVYKTRADIIPETFYYICNGTNDVDTSVEVIVDYYPEAQGVQCISYQRRKLECTWKSLNKNNVFKMFATFNRYDYDEIWQDHTGDTTRVFSWYYTMASAPYQWSHLHSFDLVLQTCNEIFCMNQTFTLYDNSICKFNRPSDLRILNTTSRGVEVAWGLEDSWVDIVPTYELEYRLLGSAWQQANTSSVRCELGWMVSDFTKCKFHLNLKCPNAHYKLRLFVRPTQATEERIWSEPAYLFFFTKRQNRVTVDPECNQKSETRKPLPSASVMFYEAEQLVNYEREKELSLQLQVEALTEKRIQIKELMDYLNSGV